MGYSHRFFLYAPVALLLLVTTGLLVWWQLSAKAFDAQLAADNSRVIMPGVRMAYDSKSLGGDPFRLDAVLDGFSLEVQLRSGPLIWRTEHLAIHQPTYGRAQQIFEAAGTQTLSWTGSDGARHRISFVPGTLRASAILESGRLARFDLDLAALNSPEVSGDRVQVHLRREPGRDALQFFVSADNLHLAPDMRAGIADTIKGFDLEGRVLPTSPLQPLLAGRADWRTGAEDWRTHNGVVKLDAFAISWGRLKANGTGELWLDATHRTRGHVSFNLQGADTWRSHDSDLHSSAGWLAGALRAAAERLMPDRRSALSVTLSPRPDGGLSFAASGQEKRAGTAFIEQSPTAFFAPVY